MLVNDLIKILNTIEEKNIAFVINNKSEELYKVKCDDELGIVVLHFRDLED